jgi:hypothetical protein
MVDVGNSCRVAVGLLLVSAVNSGNRKVISRAMARIMRIVAVSVAAAAIGMGTSAVALAASAATTSRAPGGTNARIISPKITGPGVTAATAVSGDWEGRYTCSQGLTGLDLKVSRAGHSLRATFSFYPLPGNPSVPVGIYTMRGTYHSAARIVLRGHSWLTHPAGYALVGLSGRISGGRFHGTVQGPSCTTFSLRKPAGHPSRSNVVATWRGSYLGCGQGPTGLRLVVKRKGSAADRIKATFSFFALPSNPAVPSGSYSMTGYYFPGGVALDGTRWIHQPAGYGIVNLVGVPPRPGGKKFRGAIVGCTTFSLKRS